MEHAHATVQTVSYLWPIVFFPLLGVLFNIFVAPGLGRKAVNIVSPGMILVAFLFSCKAVVELSGLPHGSALLDTLYPWITAGQFHVDFALRVDALSAVMI